MTKHTLNFALLALTSIISFSAQAQPSMNHVVIAPHCLSQHVTALHKILSTQNSLDLLQTTNAGIDQLIAAKSLRTNTVCGGFMDVTGDWRAAKASQKTNLFLSRYATPNKASAKHTTEYTIQHKEQVLALIKQANPNQMWTDLSELSSFKNRFANSSDGVSAANWIKTQVETIIQAYGRTDASVYFVPTTYYRQPSIVLKIGESTEPGVVIGAHFDTLDSICARKPGADDDGSGSVTALETARTLLASDWRPNKPIYIIWYSAEELGLIGSQQVVKTFESQQIAVSAVLQLDMTGYANQNDPTIWLVNDHVNPELTKYLETLIKTYVNVPVDYTHCGYACSDHASWTKAGIPAAFPFEAAFKKDNPYIHTENDTLDKLSLQHMTDFEKLALAFVGELC